MLDISLASRLGDAIEARRARVGICGLGYVGLPLAGATARAGFPTIGFDVDSGKIELLSSGQSYIGAVSNEELTQLVGEGLLEATTDFSRLVGCDVIVICVPTPLTRQREPDLSFVEQTATTIARHMRPGQLVVLESTTYPGTTDGIVKPLLERSGLQVGREVFLGFSPEREDPGNADFKTTSIPKIVSGDDDHTRDLIRLFYESVVDQVVVVSSNGTAEAVKITENIFRAVNIALVNELKMIFEAMDIDIWEVIEAAKTKPFGFMPFYPGPGLGGHCIPVDPFYLTWKSREFDVPTRFIELAGEINTMMPRYVVGRLAEALDRRNGRALSQARILLLGLAYKKNVADTRESPAMKLVELLENRGARVEFHDPFIAEIGPTREHPKLAGRRSVPFTAQSVANYDAVLVVTDHDDVDYTLLDSARLIVDTRNVCMRRGLRMDKVVKA